MCGTEKACVYIAGKLVLYGNRFLVELVLSLRSFVAFIQSGLLNGNSVYVRSVAVCDCWEWLTDGFSVSS